MITILYSGGLWGSLMEMMDKVSNANLEGFIDLSVVLAAFLAAFSLVRFATTYVQGDNSFSWKLARPIVILLCVMNFSLLCNVFDSTIGIFSRDIADAAGGSFKELYMSMTNSYKVADDNLHRSVEDGLSNSVGEPWYKRVWEVMKTATKRLDNRTAIESLSIVSLFTRLIIEAIFLVMEFLAAFYLALMRVFGPFILALSIPENWKDSTAKLVARYIQVSLWMPVGYVIIGILTKLFGVVCGALATGSAEFGAGMTAFCLTVVGITAMLAIPKVAGWIVESAGSGNAQSTLEKGISSGGKKLLRL